MQNEAEIAEAKKQADAANRPQYIPNDSIIDDWTGTKFVNPGKPSLAQKKHHALHQHKKHRRRHHAQNLELEDDNLLQLDSSNLQTHKASVDTTADLTTDLEAGTSAEVEAGAEALAEVSLQVEAEAGTDAAFDPMDPHLTDLDKIMKTYEDEDASKELAQKTMALGDDPKGGIDKISAGSYAHNKDDDNKDLKTLFESYSSAAKGDDGLPDAEDRIVTQWQARLAAEESIKNWNELSEAALEKFMTNNFNASWKKFDVYGRESIPMIDAVPFIRDLMTAQAPPALPEVNPYEEQPKKQEKPIEVDPIVEPDIDDEKKLIKNSAKNDEKKA